MALNQERYFKPNSVIGDSSKLRFSQACKVFDLDLFNTAAKSDNLLTKFIKNLQAEAAEKRADNIRRSLEPLRFNARLDSSLINPRAMRLQSSPNAPNTLPAFSLAAA